MQWRRQKRVTHVIGSSNHVLLLARYQDAPPGEEDEEEGLRKDFVKNQEKDANAHTFDRNGQQTGYKPRRTGTTSTSGGSTSGYASSGSRSHRDESTGSPSQPKIIFNEDEYTRITTPRQDVLFKKGYLSRKKPWTGNASTSATPSTTESQSASHSTADGSETTEDQQLLDRDSGTGEYPPVVEPGAQLGYGTFYDHASGYYYEYPVMLVGPAPVPAHVGPSVLATVPCGPVPLRPIEWINPAFVPKLANQPYCLMDYQASQTTEPVTIVEEQNGTIAAAEASNSVWNESGTGSASCSGSVAGENEEQAEEADKAIMDQHNTAKEQLMEEQHPEHQYLEGQQHLENGMTTVDPYLDPLLMQEPVHVPHVIPAVPQPYMYPGHYMFGPPLVNVNGVTIQGGPLVRTMDVTAMTMACAKRRKKRKKRKQRRPTLGNTEDEEEGEYSSECDNDASSSRLAWSESPTSTATTTTVTTATNRPLNPECQEFQLRPRILSNPTSMSVVDTVTEEVASLANDASNLSSYETEPCETGSCDVPSVQSPTKQEAATICNSEDVAAETPVESVQAATVGRKPKNKNVELNGQTNHLVADTETIVTSETVEVKKGGLTDHKASSKTDTTDKSADESPISAKHELLESNGNGIDTDLLNNCVEHPEEALTNGETEHFVDLTAKARSVSPQVSTANLHLTTTTTDISEGKEKEEEDQRPRHCNSSSIARTTTSFGPARKYNSKKGGKFVREPTPGPDLDDTTHLDLENGKIVQQSMAVELSDDDVRAVADVADDKLGETNRKAMDDEEMVSEIRGNMNNTTMTSQDAITSSNEDSGFESQTRLSEYPITAAVTEWLRRVNSPDLFVTSGSTSDSETDEDEEVNAKPPKNLQGNPMPALSANSGVDNVTSLSRAASCGEFAKTNNNNIKIDQVEADSTSTSIGRRRKDAKGVKRKSKAKRIEKRNRNVDEKTQSHLVSCDRLRDLVAAVRLRNTLKHNVADVCEFTQEDSVAGMRVALSSRINTKRASARRAKTLRRIGGNPVENIDIKMRRIDDLSGEGSKETNGGSTVSVRTFEKGEIIVSKDGKLLPTSAYEPVPLNGQGDPDVVRSAARVDAIDENAEVREETRNSSENDENGSVMMSSVSIEEPDVLECWEAETIEPVVTPRRLLQSAGVLCDGEAAEEDDLEAEQEATIEHVQKYYRFARDSAISGEPSGLSTSVVSSRTVPNRSEERRPIEYFCCEEIPVLVPDRNRDVVCADEKIPVDEAFEVCESCYTGKSPFLPFDTKVFKQQAERPLCQQNGEGPTPCRAVCCNVQ
ncbi:uncharacterized protein LOC105277616 isoform X2 [Ooceraea biroi]|uniref:uncharacterized protein LOC105277616 isoform X2 n=1 Tax=Ooceraea biroi TaxID=2015173 RepID=UPI000F0956F8|nr:uncharacterized protein LOC105277616 isoform X2 [Ooceraea biroi]